MADEEAPVFSVQEPFYRSQLNKNLVMNVYRNGVWGDYGHFRMAAVQYVETSHAFVDTQFSGDLSTLRWIEGPLNALT